jgi:transposase
LHLDVLAGSYNAQDFNSFIDGLLDNMNPYPGPNSVIVMDNASIHKSAELRQMIEQRCVQFASSSPVTD